MNVASGMESFRSLLPAALQPYPLLILIAISVVVLIVFWRLIGFVMRLGWVIRTILLIASLVAYSGVKGCSAGIGEGTRQAFTAARTQFGAP